MVWRAAGLVACAVVVGTGAARVDEESASVWVFLGEQSRWASAVFSTRELAERWVGEIGLTGMLTQYPLDVGS